jgi:hypothetical protein
MEISRSCARQTRLEDARQKLSRLMPFDEWCRSVNPTETAKELYEFVRLTLESELERSRRISDAVPQEARRPARSRRAQPRER